MPSLAESGCNWSDGGNGVFSGWNASGSQCTDPGLRAERGRLQFIHLLPKQAVFQCLVQILTIDEPMALLLGLLESMQYLRW